MQPIERIFSRQAPETRFAVSRRNFFKGTFAVAGGLTVDQLFRNVPELVELLTVPDWLNRPDVYSFILAHPSYPRHLIGIHSSSPYLAQQPPNVRQEHINYMGVIRGSNVFYSDGTEHQLGEYNPTYLANVISFAHQLDRSGKTIQVVILDGYGLRKRWNIFYGGNEITSPYYGAGKGDMYTNQILIDAYLRRSEVILRELSKLPNLTAVTIANELEDDNGEMNNWYKIVAPHVKSLVPNAVVASGLIEPGMLGDDIPGLDLETLHAYPTLIDWDEVGRYCKSKKRPVWVQEFGVPGGLFGWSLPDEINDVLLHNYLCSILIRSNDVDQSRKTVTMWMPSLSVWKYDTYQDTFNFHPKRFPHTYGLMEMINRVTDKLLLTNPQT